MNELKTHEKPLLRGARSAHVGTPNGMTEASNAKFAA